MTFLLIKKIKKIATKKGGENRVENIIKEIQPPLIVVL